MDMVCEMKWIFFYGIHIFINLGYGLYDFDKTDLERKFNRYPEPYNEIKNLDLVYRFKQPLRPVLSRNYEYLDYSVYHLPKGTIRYKYSIKKKSTKNTEYDFMIPKTTSKDITEILNHIRTITKHSSSFGKLDSFTPENTDIWQEKQSHRNLLNTTPNITPANITTNKVSVWLQSKSDQNISMAFVNHPELKKNMSSVQKSNQITLKLIPESNSTHDKNNIFKAEDEYSESSGEETQVLTDISEHSLTYTSEEYQNSIHGHRSEYYDEKIFSQNIVKEKQKNKMNKGDNEGDKNEENTKYFNKNNKDANRSFVNNINDEDINDTTYEFGMDEDKKVIDADDPDYPDKYFHKNKRNNDEENKKGDEEKYSNFNKQQDGSSSLVNYIYSTHYIAHQVSPTLPFIQPNYPNPQPVIPFPIAVPSPVPILRPIVSHYHHPYIHREMPFYGEPEMYFLSPSPIVHYYDYLSSIHQQFPPSLPPPPLPLPPPQPPPPPLLPSSPPPPLPPPLPPAHAPNNFVPQSNLGLNNMAPVFNLSFDINTGDGDGGGKKSKMVSQKACDNESYDASIADLTQEQSLIDYNEQKSNNMNDIVKPKQNDSAVENIITENLLYVKTATDNMIKHTVSRKTCANESCDAFIADLPQEQSLIDHNEQKLNNINDIVKPKQNSSAVENIITEKVLNVKTATDNLIKHTADNKHDSSEPYDTTSDNDKENDSVLISSENNIIETFNKTLQVTENISESTTLVYNTSIGLQDFINKFDFRNSFYENVNLTRQKLDEENQSLINSLSVSDNE